MNPNSGIRRTLLGVVFVDMDLGLAKWINFVEKRRLKILNLTRENDWKYWTNTLKVKNKDFLDTKRASGQAINLQKFQVFFNTNTSQEVRDELQKMFGVSQCLGSGKYLRMPSIIGRNKKSIFNYLRDELWRKIQTWWGKHLSRDEKEILIKSVARRSQPTLWDFSYYSLLLVKRWKDWSILFGGIREETKEEG